MTRPTLAELSAMSDDELAYNGFRRNDKGGITRMERGELLGSKKGFGFFSFMVAMSSGTACAELQYARISVCNACEEKDSKGERLYRINNTTAYCGVPRDLAHLAQLYRDEIKDGCGCSLTRKVSKIESDCPLKKWPAPDAIQPRPPRIQQSGPAPKPFLPGRPCGCGGKAKPPGSP